jgi:hypothetical protein
MRSQCSQHIDVYYDPKVKPIRCPPHPPLPPWMMLCWTNILDLNPWTLLNYAEQIIDWVFLHMKYEHSGGERPWECRHLWTARCETVISATGAAPELKHSDAGFSSQRGIYGGQVTLQLVLSEYCGFPFQFSFHHVPHVEKSLFLWRYVVPIRIKVKNIKLSLCLTNVMKHCTMKAYGGVDV